MKTKVFFFFLLFVATTTCGIAQKKVLTLGDAVLKGRSTLAPEKLDQLNWLPGTNQYVFVKNKKIVITDAVTQKTDSIIIDSSSLKQYTGGYLPLMGWINKESFYFQTQKGVYSYNINKKQFEQWSTLPVGSGNVDICTFNHSVTYLQKNKLMVSVGGEIHEVAAPEKEGIVYGEAVHRNEFGITKGTFWSPKGNKLAYYKMDESMVASYPIYQLKSKPATTKAIRYPMAGATSHHVDVIVYDAATKKNIQLKVTGPADQYLTNIAWSPDEKHVYIAVVNRDQNHVWLNRYDAASGDFVNTLFEETSDTYTEPLTPVIFTPSGNHFLWQSERDGNNSIYVYDLNGKVVQQLAKGYVILSFIGFDAIGKNIFVQALSKDNISRICLQVNLQDGKPTMIGSDGVTNITQMSSTGEYVINQVTAVDIPRRYELGNVKTKKATIFFEAPDPLKNYIIGQTEFKTLAASDGTPLFARMIKPANFDPVKKYPVVVYVYGGPHAQMVTNTWLAAGELWQHYLANKGYIVFTLDNRGSESRDRKFKTAPVRQLGTIEMEDQMAGINYLKSLPYIDATRIGVNGWSYGGFMTVSLMTRMPGVFKAAVAGGAVIDWNYYETMYTERYMGTPENNAQGYKDNSLFNYIDNLQGKLLLIHGTSDDVVLWQHSLLYLQQCIEKGKQVDYMVYPGHAHNVPGKDRIHLIKKITDYFIDNL